MGEVGNTTVEDPKLNGDMNGTHDDVEPMEVDNEIDNELLPDPAELKKNLCTENSKDSDTNGNGQEILEPGDVDGPLEESERGENSNSEAENGNGTTDETSQEAMEVDGKTENTQNAVQNEKESSAQNEEEIGEIEAINKYPIDTVDKPEKIEDEPVVLSDTDDEDEDSTTSSSSKLKSGTQSSAVSDSENDIANSSTNPSRIGEYDDKPVSIHSDSEEEENSQKTNGAKNADLSDKDDCIVIDDDEKKDEEASTPEKKSGENENDEISPRRSLRQRKPIINKPDYDDDIEEIIEDPLDCSQQAKRIKLSDTSIDLTNKSQEKSKEPSLVIIDTESIMQKRSSLGQGQSSYLTANQSNSLSRLSSGATGNSVLNPFAQAAAASNSSNLLPNLTDDMFVLEAPSFIVPYIYEKPPPKDLKDVINTLGAEIEEQKRLAKERKLREEGDDSEDNESDTVDSVKGKDTPVQQNLDEKDKDIDMDAAKDKDRKKKSKKRNKDGDESWDEEDTSTDDEASDSEKRTKVLIKEADLDDIKTHVISADALSAADKKSDCYFDSPLGKFFLTIGVNLVQEHVQADLLKQQRRKREREGKAPSESTQRAINSLMKNLELSRENNAIYKYKLKRCDFCPFKTESQLALSHHYETPHLRGNIYKCNFCEFETRPAHEMIYHMEAMHNIKGKLEKPLSYHQCPNCPFEDNGKSKLARHEVACAKKYKPDINLCPPLDWEPPAKIPKIKAKHGLVGAATAYQAMAAQQQQRVAQAVAVAASVNKMNSNAAAIAAANALKNRGRPQTVTKASPTGTVLRTNQFRPNMNTSGMMLPNNYQLAAATLAANSQLLQQAQKLALLSNTNTTAYLSNMAANSKSSKPGGSTPSISITPLPRQQAQAGIKPGQNPNASNKAQFVICEICDGYIKDLDQLRNHMQWIHKVKIHPKMIYNRPPLNCQKCQFRFFTDQGLERHLLGSHGLVTSSMQEAANKGKDAGRCPVCGKVYQWKLLNHVSRDHNMTLKPAHLSYKCTVCTATFGMYKQFESHVYSAHSTVAKKDGKNKAGSSSNSAAGSSSSSGSLLKPLKINDEITIIPQPTGKNRNSGRINEIESHVID